MDINSFNKIDNNTYNLGGVNLNYSDYIKNERAYLDRAIATYKYNPNYADDLGSKIDLLSTKELDTYSKELNSRIKYLERSIARIDNYMDIRDENHRNLNHIRDKYNKKGSDLKLTEVIQKINNPEVQKTYNQIKDPDNYSQIEGSMCIEINGLYSCKNSIESKKNSSE